MPRSPCFRCLSVCEASAGVNQWSFANRLPTSLPCRCRTAPRRFSCPLQIGNSYRLGYVRARGQRCFDHAYYATNSPDLEEAGLSKGAQPEGLLWNFGCRRRLPWMAGAAGIWPCVCRWDTSLLWDSNAAAVPRDMVTGQATPPPANLAFTAGAQLFHHYTEHGQFEQRGVRCVAISLSFRLLPAALAVCGRT